MVDTTSRSEHELISLLKQRDRTAFTRLYDDYSPALFTVILAIVKDRETANDTLQEVFVKIWKQIIQYDNQKGRLFTWLINIARNAAIDVLRSRAYKDTRKNQDLSDNVYEGANNTSMNPDRIGLKKFVERLKAEHRELIELSYFQGMTQEEISTSLNVPLGTVKTRLRAALLHLRESMKG